VAATGKRKISPRTRRAPRAPGASVARQLRRQLAEARAQQAATAEILRVISSTPTDTQPVFEAIVTSTQRLIAGKSTVLLLRRDPHFVVGAYAGPAIADLPDEVRIAPLDRDKNFPSRAILDGEVLHIPDWDADGVPEHERIVGKAFGIKSGLMVPLLREGRGIGAIAVTRGTTGPYREQEIALLQSFADQAVIAIENVRLLNETREALERQTAISEILRMISSSPGDVKLVLDAVAERAASICEARFADIILAEGETMQVASYVGDLGRPQEALPLDRSTVMGRSIVDRVPVHVPDLQHAGDEFPLGEELARRFGHRTILAMPLVRERHALGTILVRRTEVRPFEDKHLALLRTFADQAAIAIENARLFNETREALERQTATADILRLISQSPTDATPVFDAIAERARRLCDAEVGATTRFDGESLHLVGYHGTSPKAETVMRASFPRKPDPGSINGRCILARAPVQIADIEQEPEYRLQRAARAADYRSLMAVPIMQGDAIIGVLGVARKRPGRFEPKVVSLLQTFADQAVIAIQNARLFRELEEKSRQLEDANRHKSQFLASMSHELRTPLNAILGFNEMVLDGIYGEVSAEVHSALEEIQNSGTHLLRLINNVLDLAKIEAGRMELALAEYSVPEVVGRVLSTLRPIAVEKGLELLASVAEDMPLARGDAGRISQCLLNLAGNALKFTKAGKVAIGVTLVDGRLVYRVTDTGIGIPVDKIGSLFTEFKQTDATVASEYGGTGLGLSITKKFVEMHGGRIWAESEVGKGSAFIFEVPLRA
jgi:signal transduction histidine kinase